MFLYTTELNIPPIPPELLEFTPQPYKTLDTGYGQYPGSNKFSIGLVTYPPLTEWIMKAIPGVRADMIKYQTGSQGRHVVHTDILRVYALNYLIDTGGPEVITRWYQEQGQPLRRPKTRGGQLTDTGSVDYGDLDCLASVKLQAGTWALIATDILHDVQGIETTRSAITISLAPGELETLNIQI